MDAGRLGVWICLAIIVLSAITDFAFRRIPNILTLGGIFFGLALHAAVGQADGGFHGALVGLEEAALGVLLCSIVPVFSFAKRAMGGGDVKLFAAIGAICGSRLGFDAVVASFALMAVVVLPWRLLRSGVAGDALANVKLAAANLFRPAAKRVPYVDLKLPSVIMGPTILAGFCLAVARDWPR